MKKEEPTLTSKWDPYTSSEEESYRAKHEGPSKRKVPRFSMNVFKSAFSRSNRSAPDMPQMENGSSFRASPPKPLVEGLPANAATDPIPIPNSESSSHSQAESLNPSDDKNPLPTMGERMHQGDMGLSIKSKHDSHDDDESTRLPPNLSNIHSLPRLAPVSAGTAIRGIPSGSLSPSPNSSPTRSRLNRSALFGPPLSPPPSIPLPPTPTLPSHPPTVEPLREEKSAAKDIAGLQWNPIPMTTSLLPYPPDHEARNGAFSKMPSERRVITLGKTTSASTSEKGIMKESSIHSLPPSDIPLPPSPALSIFSHAGTCKSGDGHE